MQSRAHTAGQVFRLLGAFGIIAMIMGLMGAGLAIPAVGAVSEGATRSIDAFNSLPGTFETSPLSQQSQILDAKGHVIATPYDENRIIVPLSEISPWMQKAQIAIEDSRFYEHGGLDVRGFVRAAVSTLSGGQVQGASTITQQYVKLSQYEAAVKSGDQDAANAAVEVSLGRKIQELKYAMTLEEELTKDQILERYLNLVYYGDLAYGAEAAAQHYFSIHAKDLDYNQAALLAGLVQAPSTTDPINNPDRAQARRDLVLGRMAEVGDITAKQEADAKAISVNDMLKVTPAKNTCERSTEPYFCSYVIAWLKQQPALGETVEDREKALYRGGLIVQTTIDPDENDYAFKALTAKVPVGDPSKVGASAIALEPSTGAVKIMTQSSVFGGGGEWGTTEVNWNVDALYGGGTGLPFGSTGKLFAVISALEQGFSVNATIYAREPTKGSDAEFTTKDALDDCWSGYYSLHNAEGGGGGPMTFRYAVAHSVNLAFATMVITKLGVCAVGEVADRLGIHDGANRKPLQHSFSGITLGSDNVAPMTMAGAYAAVANEGKLCQPLPVTKITTRTGDEVKLPGPQCEQVISPDVAAGATELLRGVMTSGTGDGFQLSGGRASAGKTGTDDNFKSSCFIGFTPQLATMVFVGNPNERESMSRVRIGEGYYRYVYGATIAGPLWKKIMDHALDGEPNLKFPPVPGAIERGVYVGVPSVTGLSVARAKARLNAAGLDGYVAGQVNSRAPKGTVVSYSPSGSARKGSAIALYVSSGFVPPPKTTPPTTSPTPTPKPTVTQKPKPTPKPKPTASSTAGA